MLAFACSTDYVERWGKSDIEHPSKHPSIAEEPQVRAPATLVEQFFGTESTRHTRQQPQNP